MGENIYTENGKSVGSVYSEIHNVFSTTKHILNWHSKTKSKGFFIDTYIIKKLENKNISYIIFNIVNEFGDQFEYRCKYDIFIKYSIDDKFFDTDVKFIELKYCIHPTERGLLRLY